MSFLVIVEQDGNVTPRWVMRTLMQNLNIQEDEAFKVTMALASAGKADITMYCENEEVITAQALALSGLSVRLKSTNE